MTSSASLYTLYISQHYLFYLLLYCRGTDVGEQSGEVSQIEDMMFVKKDMIGRKADRPINVDDSSVSHDPCVCGCGVRVFFKVCE
jgi:hypothetical protein